MRFRTPLTLAALLILTCAVAHAQEGTKKEQQVVDDFVVTRGVSFDEPVNKKKKVTPRPGPRKSTTPATSAKSGKGGGARPAGGTEAAQTTDAGTQFVEAGGAKRPLALGYTILMKDDSGGLFVADASREFKTGDRFAVALETNEDGYLYLFSATDGRSPELLFPNAQIEGGANAVRAHARATFPAAASADAQYFIDVTDPPATEHLFVIFSRRPLADVPAGEALVKFCGKNLEDCAWRPSAAQWARIIGAANGRRVIEAKNTQLAQGPAQPFMPNSLQRGLKVKREDPKPAVVRVSDTPDADVLVTEIVLVHK